ncbi:PREDICTED: uncharacterized protein LOC109185071 [Ipomoea nil]|uniref:uncharacterized protein LOC109185071 n=1 Tax=Ipomoea nil TaxID=35883 RepID=UPI000901282B|nr:PREDICTED: uncharacterized protein LOC109185071 [Ipomoea nil]
MEFPREGLSNTRPPALIGTNFSYWKARMQIYILAQGEGVWNAIENEWKTPVDDKGNIKPKIDWSEEEKTEYNFNSKAMNAIYGAVSEDTFKLIASTRIAKIAWSILCDHHEGNTTVRQSKLQMIETEFENLKMEEEESITQFSARVLSISGDAFNLVEPIPEHRIVKKVLRSLPGRFQMKVTAIQEHKDLNTYKLSDLMGNLQTYELEILQKGKDNDKGIAFQSKQKGSPEIDTETMEQSIALLTKNFNRVLKQFNKFRNKSASINQGDFPTGQNQSISKRRDSSNTEGIQCYECKGFGHIQSECATYLKRKNKTYISTLSDDSDSEEDDSNTNFVAFTASHESNNSDDMQELLEAYTQLNAKWEQIIKKNLELMEDNHYLKNEKERIEKQYKEAQNELLDFKNKEAKLLQEIKELTERPRTPSTDTSENHQTETQEVSQQHFRHRRRIRCYYCRKLGHIKTHCYKRQNDLYYRQNNRVWPTQNRNNSKKIWYKNEGHVTFGDGGKGQIIANGTLNVHGLPKLSKVLLVQSLKANLISISQLCEDELKVEFSRESCNVFNQNHDCVMMGKRSTNKCYTWGSDLSGLQTTISQTQLWHQRMGHINFHDQGVSPGYSSNSVIIDDVTSAITTDDDKSPRVVETTVPTPLTNDMQNCRTETKPNEEKDKSHPTVLKNQKNHPLENIMGDLNQRIKTRGKKQDFHKIKGVYCHTSKFDPKKH